MPKYRCAKDWVGELRKVTEKVVGVSLADGHMDVTGIETTEDLTEREIEAIEKLIGKKLRKEG